MKPSILISATKRLLISVGAGVAAGVVAGLLTGAGLGALIGVTVATTLFVVLGTVVLWPMTSAETQANASRQDFRPFVDEVIVAGGQLCGIGGIITLLVMGGSDAGPIPAAVALLGVFMSWAGLQILYAVRYAYMYFGDGTPGGIDFNTGDTPNYQDFFYFGFAVGMTFGVTDTGVSDRAIRAVVLRHSLLSYVFNAVILATAINLVVGVFS